MYWNRTWGKYSFGCGLVPPCFAIRITQVTALSDLSIRCITVGVVHRPSAKQDKSSMVEGCTGAACGADPTVYGVCSEDTPKPMSPIEDVPNSAHPEVKRPSRLSCLAALKIFTSAVHGGQIISPILSTLADDNRRGRFHDLVSNRSESDTAMYHLEVPECDGFAMSGSVIGVACDIEKNSLRFYLNDKPMRATRRYENAYRTPDSVPSPGSVYSLPVSTAHPLSDCHPYIAVYAATVTAQFVLDWQPPQSQLK